MKTCLAALTAATFLAHSCFAAPPAPVLAEPILLGATQSAGAINAKPNAGGLTPCLLTCLLGPRVGAEHNEGRGTAVSEWVSLAFFPARVFTGIHAYNGKTMTEWAEERELDIRPIPPGRGNDSPGGIGSCLIGICLGPRPAFEKNEGRQLRTKEILMFVPVVNVLMVILMSRESYQGKTMTQIAKDEGLDD